MDEGGFQCETGALATRLERCPVALPGLLSALKIVPWADVIAAAPAIVKGARKMFRREEEAAEATFAPIPADADPQQRLRELESRVIELAERQKTAAALVEALAEQNAAVVQALAVARARQRWLIGGLVVLAAGWGLTLVALSYGAFGPR